MTLLRMRVAPLVAALLTSACASHPHTSSAAAPGVDETRSSQGAGYKNVPARVMEGRLVAKAELRLPAAAATHAGRETIGIYKVCVDRDGVVSRVSVLSSIPGADAQLSDSIRTWRYEPQPIPVCYAARLVFDASGLEIANRADAGRTAIYRACVDTTGTVTSVETLKTIAGHDDAVAKSAAWLRTRKFRAQPIPSCAVVNVVLDALPVEPPPAR